MAMCARKDLMRDLKKRRAAFRKKMGEAFFEELEANIDQKMVVVAERQ